MGGSVMNKIKKRMEQLRFTMFVRLFVFYIFLFPLYVFSNTSSNLIKETEILNNESLTTINRVYRSIVLNPDFSERAIKHSDTLYIVGDGINYDANYGQSKANYQKTDTALVSSTKEGYIFENITNSIQTYFPEDLSKPIIIAHNDYQLELKYLSANNSQYKKIDEETIIYENAFSNLDLQFKIEGGRLRGKVILKSANCPDQIQYLLTSNSLIPTNSDGESLIPTNFKGSEIESENILSNNLDSVLFKNTKDEIIFFQEPSDFSQDDNQRVSVNIGYNADDNATGIIKTIIFNKESKEYLSKDNILREDYWDYPFTWDDPVSVYNNNKPTEFVAGGTYLIEDDLYYAGSSYSVYMRPGVILKFKAGKKFYFSSGAGLRIYGGPANYVTVTSWKDDTVGADTDLVSGSDAGNPNPGDYIGFQSYNGGSIYIDHLKMRYAGYQGTNPIYLYRTQNANPSLNIKNSIFINNCTAPSSTTETYTIYVQDSAPAIYTSHGNHYFTNNLFYNPNASTQIYVRLIGNFYAYGGSCKAYNNTFYEGRELEGDISPAIIVFAATNYFHHVAKIYYNLFAQLNQDILASGGNLDAYIDYNGCWLVVNRYNQLHRIDVPDSTNPFRESENGSRYLKQDNNDLVNGGNLPSYYGNPSNVDFSLLTTKGISSQENYQRLITNDIDDGVTHTWSKMDRDTGNIDIGYHYDPIDYIIKPVNLWPGTNIPTLSITGEGTELIINSGVTIAFSESRTYYRDQTIFFYDGAKLETPSITNETKYADLIKITSVLNMGEKFTQEMSHYGDYLYYRMYNCALQFLPDVPQDASLIQGIEISNAGSAITIVNPMNTTIYYCLLRDSAIGVNNYGSNINMYGCLFFNNAYAGAQYVTPYSGWIIQNSTFDSDNYGIFIDSTTNGWIMNNIIKNTKLHCIYNDTYDGKEEHKFWCVRYNQFWSYGSDTPMYGIKADEIATQNNIGDPKHLAENLSSENLRFCHYFLDQTNSPCVCTGDPWASPTNETNHYGTTRRSDHFEDIVDYTLNPADYIDRGFHYIDWEEEP